MKVSLFIENLETDLIVSINESNLPNPILAKDFVCSLQDASFWIEPDINGFPALCTNIPELSNIELTMQRQDETTYTAQCGVFFGGHPIHKPH